MRFLRALLLLFIAQGTMADSWDKFVGQKAEEVVEKIRQERPDLKTVVAVPKGNPVTMDFRMDRVRVFHDSKGLVAYPPKTG